MPSTHLICFECRSHKREIQIALTSWERDHPSNICQHCGKEMVRMSSSNKIPKKRDNKAWRTLERRYYHFKKLNAPMEFFKHLGRIKVRFENELKLG